MRNPTLKEETKRDRFKRLATARVNKIIDNLRLLSNLGTSDYEYTDDELHRMFLAIQTELDVTRATLENRTQTAKSFTF